MPALKSRRRLPSTSSIVQPWALAGTTGYARGTLDLGARLRTRQLGHDVGNGRGLHDLLGSLSHGNTSRLLRVAAGYRAAAGPNSLYAGWIVPQV
jgi:hypothetical protein